MGKKNSKGIKRKSEASVLGLGGGRGPDEVRVWELPRKNVGLVSRAAILPTFIPHRPGRAETLGGKPGLQEGRRGPEKACDLGSHIRGRTNEPGLFGLSLQQQELGVLGEVMRTP